MTWMNEFCMIHTKFPACHGKVTGCVFCVVWLTGNLYQNIFTGCEIYVVEGHELGGAFHGLESNTQRIDSMEIYATRCERIAVIKLGSKTNIVMERIQVFPRQETETFD